MTFQDVSSKIIKESINTAVYIDDKVLLPFEEHKKGLVAQAALFKAFKNNNCFLDFNRHTKGNIEEYKQILINKDLLILDWHLSENPNDLSDTFDILNLAINTPSLHFCVIYTDQRQADLQEKVVLSIASYFSGLTEDAIENSNEKYEEFLDLTGWSDAQKGNFTNELKKLTKEIFLEYNDSEKRGEKTKAINKLISTLGIEKSIDAFKQFLGELGLETDNYTEQLPILSFILARAEAPKLGRKYKTSLSPDKYTIRINNLYIKVISKDSQTDLYNDFTSSLVNESNIFLTLLGLEIRNRFRETSRFIGNELDGLNQLAFFHHRKTHFAGYTNLFNEFLKDIWKDQSASFLMEKDIELFSVIDEFIANNNIENSLGKFTKAIPGNVKDLAKLNLAYNRLAIKRKENDTIRFGDIFLLNVKKNEFVYILCLTPHCDCLRPQKIKNMFFFVEGKDIGMTKGVEMSDGDFISFVEDLDQDITCIDWTGNDVDCKPFSAYIKDNRIKGADKTISINYRGTYRKATYVCTLKENYAQRIANKAFAYPLRVGIDFASFKEH